jgi:hypothetical protein
MTLTLQKLPNPLLIAKLASMEAVPAWAMAGEFFSVTRTSDELSIVCDAKRVPNHVKSEGPWIALRVKGSLDFALTGILSSLTVPLAKEKISIFAISTFDTDYLLVKQESFEKAVLVLNASGFNIETDLV